MKKLYNPSGAYKDDEGKRFDVIMTRGEVDIYTELRVSEALLTIRRSMDNTFSDMVDGSIRVINPVKMSKYYPFGVGKYAFGNMQSTTAKTLNMPIARVQAPEKQANRIALYNHAMRMQTLGTGNRV